jgi:hypothetical protein
MTASVFAVVAKMDPRNWIDHSCEDSANVAHASLGTMISKPLSASSRVMPVTHMSVITPVTTTGSACRAVWERLF